MTTADRLRNMTTGEAEAWRAGYAHALRLAAKGCRTLEVGEAARILTPKEILQAVAAGLDAMRMAVLLEADDAEP